jgi:hypothetical protein
MMMKINKTTRTFMILKSLLRKIIVEDHGNEKSLESTAQVYHRHTREQKLPKRLEDFVIFIG